MKRSFQYDPANPKADEVLRYAFQEIRKAGEKVRIAVGPPTRSLEQNDRMWAMLTDISKQVQWPVNGRLETLSPEDWKHIFTASLKRQQRVAQQLDGGFVMLGQSTSKMTVREVSDLMEVISAFGTERDVRWGEV